MRRVEGRVLATNTGSGLEGAAVLLHDVNEPGSEPRVMTHSDAEGNFEFLVPRADLPADTGLAGLPFELRAEGYQRYRVPQDAVRRDRFLRDSSMSASPRSISLLVYLSPAHHISGRVVDEQGLGTPADLYLLDPLGELMDEASIGSTDADGYFDLRDVGEFFYGQPRALPILALGERGTGFLLAGKDLPTDLGANVPPPPLEDLVIELASLSLRARVVDTNGEPIPGVTVEAKAYDYTWNTGMPVDPPLGRHLWQDQLPPAFAARFRATSDHEGRVEFEHLPLVDSPYVGRINDVPMTMWTLHASAPGYLTATDHGTMVLPVTPELPAELALGHGETELILRRPDPLRITGRALDAEGEGVRCAQLCAIDLNSGFLADEDGNWTYDLPDRSDLPQMIQCVVPGYATRTWMVTEELATGASELAHDFHLLAPVGLYLQALDAAGDPLDGVPIHVLGTDPDTGEPWSMGHTTTQLGGWARYDEVPAGEWTVRIGDSHLASDLDVVEFEDRVLLGAELLTRTYTVTPH